LLLKYGYPLPYEAQKLSDSKAVKEYHRISIDAHWIEITFADIVRSAKTIRSTSLLGELAALCSVLDCTLANRRRIRAVAFKWLAHARKVTRILGNSLIVYRRTSSSLPSFEAATEWGARESVPFRKLGCLLVVSVQHVG
jgi:hypothetical protein